MRWKPINRYQVWQLWYAWHPVTLDDGTRVWLELVERKLRGGYDDSWIYRLPGQKQAEQSD